MKKLFNLLMLFLAMFMFVACNKDEEKTQPVEQGGDINFEVSEDINKEVKLTDTGKNAVSSLVTELGFEEALDNQKLEVVVSFVEMARLSDEKVVAICDLIKSNKDLFAMFFGTRTPMAAAEEEALFSVDELKAAVKFVKDFLNLIGDDTFGLFAYNFSVAMLAQQQIEIEGLTVDSMVVQSRFMMATLKGVFGSIEDSEIEYLYNLILSSKTPTAEEAAKLVDIVEGAVAAINFSDEVFENYYKVVKEETVKIMEFLQQLLGQFEGTEAEGAIMIVIASAIESSMAIMDLSAKATPALIQLIENALGNLDTAAFEKLIVEMYTVGKQDDETGIYVKSYYINEKKVSEEEYEKAQFEQTKTIINVFYEAYKDLDDKDEAALVGYVEGSLLQLEKTLLESLPEGIEVPEYKGETATLNEVFAALEIFLAKETLDEAALNALADKALGYVASKAPTFVVAMMGE